jgi:hypothetical protein
MPIIKDLLAPMHENVSIAVIPGLIRKPVVRTDRISSLAGMTALMHFHGYFMMKNVPEEPCEVFSQCRFGACLPAL